MSACSGQAPSPRFSPSGSAVAAGVGVPIFVVGLLVAFIGLWRLRGDTRNMARAGTATVVDFFRRSRRSAGADAWLCGLRDCATETRCGAGDADTRSGRISGDVATDLGAVPMFRGSAARTGENPGPAPVTTTDGAVEDVRRRGDATRRRSSRTGSSTSRPRPVAWSLWHSPMARNAGEPQVGEYVARTTPAIDAGTLFVAAGYTLLAVDAATGQQRWSVPLRFAGSCSPVAVDGRVYVATQEGHVSAFESEHGDEVWHYRNDNLLFASPALDAGVVVIGDEAGMVTAINAGTGREMWQKACGW